MADQSKIEKSTTTEEFHTAETGQDKKLDRLADEAANKAAKTEKRYDKAHDIFTK
jgi:hypothetical protein